jgi:hypothetical protein
MDLVASYVSYRADGIIKRKANRINEENYLDKVCSKIQKPKQRPECIFFLRKFSTAS